MTKPLHYPLATALAMATLSLVLVTWSPSTRAGPVEYVKICNTYGTGYFYIPGTDTCQDANQISANQDSISKFATTAYRGIAISTSMVTPFMPANAHYAVSAHMASFSGTKAVGVAGLMRVGNSNLIVSGAIGASRDGWPKAERAGVEYAW